MKAEYNLNVENFNNLTTKEVAIIEFKKDLSQFLDGFKFKKHGSDIITDKTGITARTIRRYVKNESDPTVHNMIQIYKVIHKECTNVESFLAALPQAAADIIKAHPEFEFLTFNDDSVVFNRNMKEDAFYRKVFIRGLQSSLLNPLTTEWIATKMGELGLEALNKLVEQGFMKLDGSVVKIVEENVPSWDSELAYHVALETVKEEFKHEKMSEAGNCVAAFYTGSVTTEAYKQILELEKEHYMKVMDICNDQKNAGEVKFYRSVFTDKV